MGVFYPGSHYVMVSNLQYNYYIRLKTQGKFYDPVWNLYVYPAVLLTFHYLYTPAGLIQAD